MPAESLDEGLITSWRSAELLLRPVAGNFDAAHLQEIHRRIFQDLPHHGPGEYRPPAPFHIKARALEESGARYYVGYANREDVEPGLRKILGDLKGGRVLIGLPQPDFTDKMSRLYSDLDYIHPFREGNSRTLRCFTAQLARSVGYQLDWTVLAESPKGRDRLYMARDQAVLERRYPGLNEFRAMQTQDRAEYEAYFIKERLGKEPNLAALLEGCIQPRSLVLTIRETISELALADVPAAAKRDIEKRLATLAKPLSKAERDQFAPSELKQIKRALGRTFGVDR